MKRVYTLKVRSEFALYIYPITIFFTDKQIYETDCLTLTRNHKSRFPHKNEPVFGNAHVNWLCFIIEKMGTVHVQYLNMQLELYYACAIGYCHRYGPEFS